MTTQILLVLNTRRDNDKNISLTNVVVFLAASSSYCSLHLGILLKNPMKKLISNHFRPTFTVSAQTILNLKTILQYASKVHSTVHLKRVFMSVWLVNLFPLAPAGIFWNYTVAKSIFLH